MDRESEMQRTPVIMGNYEKVGGEHFARQPIG
jgi:hypothetical protein